MLEKEKEGANVLKAADSKELKAAKQKYPDKEI